MKVSNTFFEAFSGEFVEIVTDVQLTENIQVSEDGHAAPVTVPLTITAYFMDHDDMWVYLSKDGESVNKAIPMNCIKHIEVVEEKNELQDILDHIAPPEEGEFH